MIDIFGGNNAINKSLVQTEEDLNDEELAIMAEFEKND
jgi:hypothetical protein